MRWMLGMRKEGGAMIDEKYIGIGNEIWCYVDACIFGEDIHGAVYERAA